MTSTVPVHATTIAIDGRGVMIEGPSGAGKSDLALRLIDRGAMLVSDDYTEITAADGVLIAAPPATIAGQIEVRGVGIVSLPHRAEIPVALLVTLGCGVDRMPETQVRMVAGVIVATIALDAFEASAPIKVEIALSRLLQG